MMKNMNLFQKVCFIGSCIFGGLATISWLIVNLSFYIFPSRGFATLASIAPVLILWMAALPSAALCLGLLTQNRPLKNPSIFVNALSITGITFVILGWLYIMIIYGLAFAGVGTTTPLWGLASDVVKAGIILGVLCMHAAFIFSYRPLRVQLVRYIAIVCAIMAGVFAFIDFSDNFSPEIYQPFTLLFGVIAFVATVATMYFSRPTASKKKQA